ncbi:hypothetical protein [Methylobacterium sp. E-005]|nr:hypothetical protein [Methylobacterium sp. E-005]
MATRILRDDVPWARHVEGDPDLARAIRAAAETTGTPTTERR